MPSEGRRINFQLDQPAHGFKRIPKQIPRLIDRTEQVAHHRKATADDIGEKYRRTTTGINPPLDFCHLQMRVYWLLDLNQTISLGQIVYNVTRASMFHQTELIGQANTEDVARN
jgi:hypothetical protein